MTIGAIVVPYTFTNTTEVADAVKVNSNFSVVAGGVNQAITELDTAQGSRATLSDRLAVSLNPDGTLKATAIPVGTYDTRTMRSISASGTIEESDAILMVDTTAGDVTLTLPPSATATVRPKVINVGLTGYSVIIEGDSADTVMGLTSYSLGTPGECREFTLLGTNWWVTG